MKDHYKEILEKLKELFDNTGCKLQTRIHKLENDYYLAVQFYPITNDMETMHNTFITPNSRYHKFLIGQDNKVSVISSTRDCIDSLATITPSIDLFLDLTDPEINWEEVVQNYVDEHCVF